MSNLITMFDVVNNMTHEQKKSFVKMKNIGRSANDESTYYDQVVDQLSENDDLINQFLKHGNPISIEKMACWAIIKQCKFFS